MLDSFFSRFSKYWVCFFACSKGNSWLFRVLLLTHWFKIWCAVAHPTCYCYWCLQWPVFGWWAPLPYVPESCRSDPQIAFVLSGMTRWTRLILCSFHSGPQASLISVPHPQGNKPGNSFLYDIVEFCKIVHLCVVSCSARFSQVSSYA